MDASAPWLEGRRSGCVQDLPGWVSSRHLFLPTLGGKKMPAATEPPRFVQWFSSVLVKRAAIVSEQT